MTLATSPIPSDWRYLQFLTSILNLSIFLLDGRPVPSSSRFFLNERWFNSNCGSGLLFWFNRSACLINLFTFSGIKRDINNLFIAYVIINSTQRFIQLSVINNSVIEPPEIFKLLLREHRRMRTTFSDVSELRRPCKFDYCADWSTTFLAAVICWYFMCLFTLCFRSVLVIKNFVFSVFHVWRMAEVATKFPPHTYSSSFCINTLTDVSVYRCKRLGYVPICKAKTSALYCKLPYAGSSTFFFNGSGLWCWVMSVHKWMEHRYIG